MISQVATTTALLVIVSLMSKILVTEASDKKGPKDLMEQCLYWRDVSSQDTDLIMRLQHAAYSLTFLNAAQTICTENELEQQVGMDLKRLKRNIDKTIQETKGLLEARRAAPKA